MSNKDDYIRNAPLPNWLEEFATRTLNKTKSNPNDIKDLFNQKNAKDSVEARVKELQERTGLNAVLGETDDQSVKTAEEKLVGGLGDGKPDKDFDPKQMEKGIEIEKEHSPDLTIRKEISKDHLTENEKYYDYLEQMEKKMDKEKKSKAEIINTLIAVANSLEEDGDFCGVQIIDRQIQKIAQENEDLEDMDTLSKKDLERAIAELEKRIEKLDYKLEHAESFKKYLAPKEEVEEMLFRAITKAKQRLRKAKKLLYKKASVELKVFKKFPKIQKFIDNVCKSRAGHIDFPAFLTMLRDERPEEINIYDEDLREYIKNKLKEEKKEISDDGEDLAGTSYTAIVVTDDDNEEIFAKPAKK